MKTHRNTLTRLFGIDLRSLAVFRVLAAVLLLVDILNRATDLNVLYTDAGVMPRDAIIQYGSYPGDLSLHFMSGGAVVTGLLFAFSALAALSLLVGFRARLSCFISWVLLVSLHTRNPLVLQGGDQLLADLLFFATFLPLGARYSVDEALAPRPPEQGLEPTTVLSVGSAALLIQVCLMYCFTALLKSGHEWRPDGTAIEYALRIEQFAKPVGVWLRNFPTFLRYMTWGTWWFELLGPFLLFAPVAFLPLRLAMIACFWGFHIGLYNCMELGVFPFVSSMAMVPFIPGEVWDFLSRRFSGFQGFGVRRERAYRLVAERRELFGKLSPCLTPTIEPSRAANRMAAVFLVLAVWWSISSVKSWDMPSFAPLDWIQNMTRIEETWDMFAPAPLREDGWYVIPGKLEDGTEVDVRHGVEQPVVWEQPARVAATYKNDRWRSYMMNLWGADDEKYRLYYAQYLCRTWNADRPEGRRLSTLEIYFVEKYNRLPLVESAPKRVKIWDHSCLDEKDDDNAPSGGMPAEQAKP